MSTTTDRPGAPGARTEAPAAHEIVRVTVPKRTFASELRAIKIVWRRELIRYFTDRLRIVTTLSSRCCSCSFSGRASSACRAPAPPAST